MQVQEQALLIGALMKAAGVRELRVSEESLVELDGEVMSWRDPATLEWVLRYRPAPVPGEVIDPQPLEIER